jgi:hypothetical protein
MTVDDFSLRQMQRITPDLVADYAKYRVLQEKYADKNYETVCPHCELTYKVASMHKKLYTEIATALMELLNVADNDEIGVDFDAI